MKKNGLPVVDANKPLRVHISKADISGSKRRDPDNCAAAVAIKREQRAHQVEVYKSRTYVQMKKDGPWIRYFTPNALYTEIIAFDRGAAMQSDDYTLRPISPANRLGAILHGGHNRRPKGPKRTPMHVVSGVRAHAPVPDRSKKS